MMGSWPTTPVKDVETIDSIKYFDSIKEYTDTGCPTGAIPKEIPFFISSFSCKLSSF